MNRYGLLTDSFYGANKTSGPAESVQPNLGSRLVVSTQVGGYA